MKRVMERFMKRNNQRKKVTIIGVAVLAVLLIIAAIVVYVIRYAPTKEKMSGYTYFGIEEGSSQVLVILDGERYENQGTYVNDRLYINQDLIESNINIRFYYDEESSQVYYSDTHHMYSYTANETGYVDEEGNTYSTDYSVLISENGTYYLDWEYVAEYTDLDYELAKNPNRLVVTTSYDEVTCVDAKGKATVRYRGGVKSLVLETVSSGARLEVTKDLGDWLEVVTPSGIKGYVSSKQVSDTYSYVRTTTYSDDYDKISFDYDINLTWFQVYGTAGNSNISSLLSSTSGVNVLSPTWYSISGSDGSLSFDGSADLVTSMHDQGIQVWVLVDDFDTSVDYEALFKSKTARTKMINRLISDATTYGYDGINLDFENINTSYSRDFLEFLRELSIAFFAIS